MLDFQSTKEIFRRTPLPMLVLKPDPPVFTIVEANDAYLKLTMSQRGDIIGKGLFEAFPEKPDESNGEEKVRRSMEMVLKTKKSHKIGLLKYDIPVRNSDEYMLKYWNTENFPLLNKKGKVRFIIHVPQDVTELILAEQKAQSSFVELQKNKDQYRSLFDHNPDAVYSVDLEGNFVSANESAAKLVECSITELLKVSFIPFVAPEDLEKVFEHSRKAAKGELQNYDTGIITAKGNRRIVNVTNLPIVVNEEIIGVYGIAKDITGQKLYETRIKASLKEKEVLLSEIHHRVKNNLAIISSLLKMQTSSVGDVKLRQLLIECEGRVQTMAMIHEMLYQHENFAKIPFGSYIRKLMNYIELNQQKKEVRIDKELIAEDIYLDLRIALPCALILNELLCNVYKHAFVNRTNGKVTVCLSSVKNICTIQVRDNGVGMPPHALKNNMTSLGLTLIHGLAMQIDGRVTVDSSEKGTTFNLSFKY